MANRNGLAGQEFETDLGLLPLVEVCLRLAPTVAAAPAAAALVASCLEQAPSAAVRIAGVGREGSRILITLAITLGTVDEVKSAAAPARVALDLVAALVERLEAFDPAFTGPLSESSTDARMASEIEIEHRAPVKRSGVGGGLSLGKAVVALLSPHERGHHA
jgi:hypothetical protein